MNYKDYYKKIGIYKITINNKIYIGSTINLYDRHKLHLSHLIHNKHRNRYLQRAYNKYGDFTFEVLEVYINIQREDLLKEELRYIELLNPEFNLVRNPVLNTFSDETKLRISNSVKRAYSEGRLINPWSLNGNYIDVYDYNCKLLHANILVKDAVEIVNVSNRSVINNSIRNKSYIIKDYIIIPANSNLKDLLSISKNVKFKHLIG